MIKQILKEEWAEFSEKAHLVAFNEFRPAGMDRIDYALLSLSPDDKILSWLTAREFDSESVYWSCGASVPDVQGTSLSAEGLQMAIDWTFERYQRISVYVKNSNVRCLKFVMNAGFRVIGVRVFDQEIYVELLNQK